MYRLIPLRMLCRTPGVILDEMVPSDIPKIDSIDKVIHASNSISPGSVEDAVPTWYMHPGQDDNLIVLQGDRYIDIYCPKRKEKTSFIVTPDKVYKNDKLYYDGSAMVVWPAGIFHRIISGEKGSISINFSTCANKFNLDDNLNTYSGTYTLIKDGIEDQPDFSYEYPSDEIKKLFKED